MRLHPSTKRGKGGRKDVQDSMLRMKELDQLKTKDRKKIESCVFSLGD